MNNTPDTKEQILDGYIEYLLTEESKPLSIYKFCKTLKIDDQMFYEHFGSFDQVESYFWSQLINHTSSLVHEDKHESTHHQILSFYYTLFENFKLHRSFILFLYQQENNVFHFEFRLRKSVKPHLTEFSKSITTAIHNISEDLGDKLTEQGMWLHFIALFNFWIKDESPGFEKTDLFIEKSIRLGIDLSNSIPTDSMLDFGKFIFKEFKKVV